MVPSADRYVVRMTLKRAGVWALAVILTLEFVVAGLAKYAASAVWARLFLQWGYPAWCRPVVGAAEIICGAALLVPVTRRYAGVVLIAIMFGAAVTRVLNGPPSQAILPVALGAMVGLLLWLSPATSSSKPS